MTGEIAQRIRARLEEALAPARIEVENESHRHNVPPGSETHFKVTVVSPRFEGLGSVARHRLVHRALATELAGPVHALALHTFAPGEVRGEVGEEGEERSLRVPDSPACRGGDGALRTRGGA